MQSDRQQFAWPFFCLRLVQHGEQASEPAAYYCPAQVQAESAPRSTWSAWPPACAYLPAEPIPKLC